MFEPISTGENENRNSLLRNMLSRATVQFGKVTCTFMKQHNNMGRLHC